MSVDLVALGDHEHDIPDEFGSFHWQQDTSCSASRKTSYSMAVDTLTALKLRPQAQRIKRASGLPGWGIPEMEANRYEGKIKADAGRLHHG
jgi:hypothetical protein